MKLKNKKTGGLANILADDQDFIRVYTDAGWHDYDSLAELNAEWEDYKPVEPLIKDEKIRKAVRAWAEANNIRAVYYSPDAQGFYVKNYDDDEIFASIYFGDKPMEKYDYDWNYTIAELCGEEEE